MPSLPGILERIRPDVPFNGIAGAVYDFGVEREHVGRVMGWLMFRMDTRLMYQSMACVADVKSGSTILDVPCGGGVVFRYLNPKQKIRFLASDIATDMLDRSKAEAERRGLKQVEIVEASVEKLPIKDASVDLCLCYNGLHCFPDPEAAIEEMARCLKPGGKIVGTTVLRGQGIQSDLVIKGMQNLGTFGPGGTKSDYRRRFKKAGFKQLSIKHTGASAIFEARK